MFVVYTLLLLMLGEIFCLPCRPVVIGTSSCSNLPTMPKRFYLPPRWSLDALHNSFWTTPFPLKKEGNGDHHVHRKLVFILRRWIRRWILLAIDHRPGWNEGLGHGKFSAVALWLRPTKPPDLFVVQKVQSTRWLSTASVWRPFTELLLNRPLCGAAGLDNVSSV